MVDNLIIIYHLKLFQLAFDFLKKKNNMNIVLKTTKNEKKIIRYITTKISL